MCARSEIDTWSWKIKQILLCARRGYVLDHDKCAVPLILASFGELLLAVPCLISLVIIKMLLVWPG